MQKIYVLQIKYKSFLNIYSFCKKIFLLIKNIFVKTSLRSQQSGPKRFRSTQSVVILKLALPKT